MASTNITVEASKFFIKHEPAQDITVAATDTNGIQLTVTDTQVYGASISLSRGEAVTVIDWLSRSIFEPVGLAAFSVIHTQSYMDEKLTLTLTPEGEVYVEVVDDYPDYGGDITLSRAEVSRLIDFSSKALYE